MEKTKEKRLGCSRCGLPEFYVEWEEKDYVPLFVCPRCGNIWTCGTDGGIYMDAFQLRLDRLQKKKPKKPFVVLKKKKRVQTET